MILMAMVYAAVTVAVAITVHNDDNNVDYDLA